MTSESVWLIDLQDIRAIRLTCQRCRSTLSLNLTETVRVPHACPNCNEDWVLFNDHMNTPDMADALARALKNYVGLTSANAGNARATVSVEITRPSQPDRS
jgi:hypothetical protein